MFKIKSASRTIVGFRRTSWSDPCSMYSMIIIGSTPFSITPPITVVMFGCRSFETIRISSIKSSLSFDKLFSSFEFFLPDDFGLIRPSSLRSIMRLSVDACKLRIPSLMSERTLIPKCSLLPIELTLSSSENFPPARNFKSGFEFKSILILSSQEKSSYSFPDMLLAESFDLSSSTRRLLWSFSMTPFFFDELEPLFSPSSKSTFSVDIVLLFGDTVGLRTFFSSYPKSALCEPLLFFFGGRTRFTATFDPRYSAIKTKPKDPVPMMMGGS
mmetsp:Transcript_2745/g.6429  ORF Transcript_2745/g.6429 Transcript_2745/m.6429 type:complete len:271 (+) Transcript_2745:1337-2149(+)